MVRKHTPEELAEANRLLEEGKPLLDALRSQELKDKLKWQKEIDSLQERITTQFIDVPLKGGGTIAIRTNLSETEEKRMVELIKSMGTDPKAIYEIVVLGTANPYITMDFLEGNPDKYSITDLLTVILAVFRQRRDEAKESYEELQRIISFREESTGTDAGGLLAVHGDNRSQGVEGSPTEDKDVLGSMV